MNQYKILDCIHTVLRVGVWYHLLRYSPLLRMSFQIYVYLPRHMKFAPNWITVKKKRRRKKLSRSHFGFNLFKMKLKYFLGRGNYTFWNFVGGKKVSHKNQNLFRSPNHPLGIKLPRKWWHLHTTSDCRAP